MSKSAVLWSLWISDNKLTNVDVSKNINLAEFSCDGNQLISLNVTKNTALHYFTCSDNRLTSLDVSNNHSLRDLHCSSNKLTSLVFSKKSALKWLKCDNNKFTSMDVSNNTHLRSLSCSANQMTNLDISKSTSLTWLSIKDMPTLSEVCVWTIPFPPGRVSVDTSNSPNVYFTDCADPTLVASDTIYRPETIEATSSEDGIIYLVPEDTDTNLVTIREACIDSVDAVANSVVDISVANLENGIYWLYARDSTGNISAPEAFTIMGVGIANTIKEQIRIYPNPFTDYTTIKSYDPLQKLKIDLIDMYGRRVRTFDNSVTNTFVIQMGNLPGGIYFIKIYSDDIIVKKVIIR